MKELWIEKYRPKTIDGYVFVDDNQRQQVESWIRDGSIPNLLFSGSPGTGKTTTFKRALAVCGGRGLALTFINSLVEDLEDKLANLKSSEVKRLEELNTQALALERERDRQRLFREEQALKAKGELSKAEAERIAKEREMQNRINRTLAEAAQELEEQETLALASACGVLAAIYRAVSAGSVNPKTNVVSDDWATIKARLYETYFRAILRLVRSVPALKRA